MCKKPPCDIKLSLDAFQKNIARQIRIAKGAKVVYEQKKDAKKNED